MTYNIIITICDIIVTINVIIIIIVCVCIRYICNINLNIIKWFRYVFKFINTSVPDINVIGFVPYLSIIDGTAIGIYIFTGLAFNFTTVSQAYIWKFNAERDQAREYISYIKSYNRNQPPIELQDLKSGTVGFRRRSLYTITEE